MEKTTTFHSNIDIYYYKILKMLKDCGPQSNSKGDRKPKPGLPFLTWQLLNRDLKKQKNIYLFVLYRRNLLSMRGLLMNRNKVKMMRSNEA